MSTGRTVKDTDRNVDLFINSVDRSFSILETTASDGSYFIGGLVPAATGYTLMPGNYMSVYYPGVFSYAEAGIINVTDLVNTGDINFNIHPGGSVSGHVYQADGKTPFYQA